jgi:glycosidase
MLWNKSSNAGFSHARPDALWLPTDPGYELKNLERQASDPHSFFSLYRTLLHLRKSSEAMRHGDFHALPTNNAEHVFAFADRYEDDQTITVVNFSGERVLGTFRVRSRLLLEKLFQAFTERSTRLQRLT